MMHAFGERTRMHLTDPEDVGTFAVHALTRGEESGMSNELITTFRNFLKRNKDALLEAVEARVPGVPRISLSSQSRTRPSERAA